MWRATSCKRRPEAFHIGFAITSSLDITFSSGRDRAPRLPHENDRLTAGSLNVKDGADPTPQGRGNYVVASSRLKPLERKCDRLRA